MPVPEPSAECWLHEDVRVGGSLIAGYGLIASAALPAGTVVSRLGGRLVSTAELDALAASSAEYVDSIVVDEDVHLVLPSMTPNHYVNHSCEPNLGWVDEYTLATLRDVEVGAELTSDYATSSNHPGLVMWCNCDTYRCRQVIEGSDWQIPQLQLRYAGQWVPYLQRLIDASTPPS